MKSIAPLSTLPPAYAVVGRYAIFDEIAAGGMATVHLGKLVGAGGFSRVVAIKRLHPQFSKDEEFSSMFMDEARLAARIHHPNVVQTLDVVTASAELLLVMEYVHGVSFASLLHSARKAGQRVDPDPFFRYSIRVDGVFRDDFLARLRRDHPVKAGARAF